ncbi:MAG TPA: bL28 family ribosomal protein [Candidatus Bipolaricaulota bacterium]|nr:bL28 family ribosomal protein [Candidatus Bipolaricaulota bacterium]
MKSCEICGKGPKKMIKRSHSMQATKTWQYPNLQSKKIDGKKVTLCTSCLSRRAKNAK